ncbi:hypothetical protein C8K30_1174 [Promicromonospora sp. AC04]|uniref:hypothetical protein n=1 Tax=Promicromonospora sp. AC04 TaxID=2135723 RepID=UPI000D40C933|nr:hypothetical protein [Promicromonospora sp. AC04]PUB20179.1 hypothetical protein C8K30_1174 [Promicromonospora sp. AC04]
MSTSEPDDEHGSEPLTPIYPFNAPGEAIYLYSGPIGGLNGSGLKGTIRLVPFPSPELRWQVRAPETAGRHPRIGHVGDRFELTAGRMTGHSTVSSASFDSVTGSSSHLEFESGDLLENALVHWMNLPNYLGNETLQYTNSDGSTWSRSRLALEIDGWSITLDGRPDGESLFKEDVGLARYVLTHVMDLRRADGSSFELESARRVIEALRLSLSFAAGRWVAPTLSDGFDTTGGKAWRSWSSPICAPYERIGSPVISPIVFGDLEAFLEVSVRKLLDADAANTTRFQMQFATQTSNLGFVENRIFSAFPAIENLSWETFVLGGVVSKAEFEKTKVWPTARRLRELLVRAHIPIGVDENRLPVLHQLAADKGVDGPGAVTWVRNQLIHPKDLQARLYTRESLVVEAWQQSREYVCMLLLHALGYTGGYLSTIPPHGWLGDSAPVPWAAQ